MDPVTLRAWWAHRQGLDGSLAGASSAEVLERAGWARSVGGVGPYLTLFSRAGMSRADADRAVAALEIHELPAARGCTYVVPAPDFALALSVGEAFGDGELKQALTLGVTEREVEALCDAIVAALPGGALAPDAIRAATGDASRSLGEAGKKKGLATTLPLALGRLQRRGAIRRVPLNGRLDQQRYAYTLWTPNPRRAGALAANETYMELARRFFRWVGPATMGEWQWFSGLGARAAKDAVQPLQLEPAENGSERLLLPDDVAAFKRFKAPARPQYALVGSLDSISATRRDVRTLAEEGDLARQVMAGNKARPLGGISDLPSHAILDRGRLIGLWEFDPEAQRIVWATFGIAADAALREAVRRTERFVRDDLGDARSFSLDSPKSRQPRLVALRQMR